VTRLTKEPVSVLKINDISFFGTPDCHHCCSIVSENANNMVMNICIINKSFKIVFVENNVIPFNIMDMNVT
jgi:hypothetical protein